MIARDMRFLLQGGPGLVGGYCKKFYRGYWCVQLATETPIQLRFGDAWQTYQPPCLWVSFPGPLIGHRPITTEQRWLHHYVACSGPLAEAWWEHGLLPNKPQVLDPQIDWSSLFQIILAIPTIPHDQWQQLEKVNALEHFLLRARRQATPMATDISWLERAKTALAGDQTLPAIAERCNMGVSTFRRHFTEATGRSPQAWRIEERLRLAQQLLQVNQQSIGDIADQLGYADIYAFSKQFRQHVGISPSEWRHAQTTGG